MRSLPQAAHAVTISCLSSTERVSHLAKGTQLCSTVGRNLARAQIIASLALIAQGRRFSQSWVPCLPSLFLEGAFRFGWSCSLACSLLTSLLPVVSLLLHSVLCATTGVSFYGLFGQDPELFDCCRAGQGKASICGAKSTHSSTTTERYLPSSIQQQLSHSRRVSSSPSMGNSFA
ncbi:hypothetical protein EDB81DRAFT_90332 [Dactylonectria macrodidyma]|uniref:Uncharacterized protein n=1 Tax=Dactylonectria macrodidyma TaxID=307937 RepID=A0A9P9EBG3_9HYPO|nr:hypothetical protein EDB81DRAFT_90332 [Dactylonectria macrodidyma]